MRVGIVGAGIGGLVAAAGLQRDGHEVAVFERKVQPGAIGAGLSLFGNAFAALDAVGLGGVVRALASEQVAEFTAGQRSPSGRWLMVMPPRAVSSLRVVHRADLHSALLGALRPGTLRCGDAVFVAHDGTPTLTIGAVEEHFDLVVAADGIHSHARSTLGLDTGLRYAGYTAWRGVTHTRIDVHGEAGEAWGRGKRFGIVPLADGRVYWFATQSLPPGTAFQDDHREALDRFGSWHDPIRELMENTSAAEVLRNDIYDLARPLASFHRGATVLLGDAAHAMTPDLGQGAGQAIEDAATITLLLRGATKNGHIADAVRVYDHARRPRAQMIARRSRAAGRVAQLSSPIPATMRDTMLALAPGALLAGATARIQHWTPPVSTPTTTP